MWLWATLQIAVAAGLSTTFDDNIYLTAFFGEVDRDFRPIHIVIGEFIGFSTLLFISLVGYAAGLILPASTVGLLGVLPILMGIQNLIAMLRERRSELAGTGTGTGSLRPAHEAATGKNTLGFKSRRVTAWDALRSRKTYDVALVCLSNGSNNLSIYIPLFASLTLAKVMVVIPILYLFITIWLGLAFSLTRMPGISVVLNRYVKLCFPWILMWLGLRILNDSGALAMLPWRP